ncbi:phosphotransferase [Kocuria palustris]|uniref:phosphotransferase n=1 Tax=Kocuria palustris TaxID=71999 RepID=UPI001642B81A|nr:phosphotransferase [Kocuria palustris]
MVPAPPAGPAEAEERRAVELLSSAGLRAALDSVLAAHGLALDRRRLAARSADRPWRRLSLHHRPGAGVTGVFAVRLRGRPFAPEARWPGLLPLQHPEEVVVCLSTGAMPGPGALGDASGGSWGDPGAVRVRTEGCALTGWLWEGDPWLPGLRSSAELAARRDGAGRLLPAPVSYRPTRRAVLRLHAPGAGDPAAWLKIVRPEREGELTRRHAMLREGGVPVPRPLGATGDGGVLLAHLPGVPASRATDGGGAARLEAEHLLALHDRLPASVMELPRRPSWTERVLDYAQAAIAALPEAAEEIGGLAAAIDAARRAADDAALVPSHGDFHAGNVLIGPRLLDPALGPITGLLDLDSIGPGRLDDDLACCLAHRCAQRSPAADDGSPLSAPPIAAALAVFDQVVDPASLRVRISGVLLSLVASAGRRGGHDAAAMRLRQAQQALRAADAL